VGRLATIADASQAGNLESPRATTGGGLYAPGMRFPVAGSIFRARRRNSRLDSVFYLGIGTHEIAGPAFGPGVAIDSHATIHGKQR
jgi:hypothetical protein